jgi:hypothetical protein
LRCRAVNRPQADIPAFCLAGICWLQYTVAIPAGVLKRQSTLQVTGCKEALSVLMITTSLAGDIAQL